MGPRLWVPDCGSHTVGPRLCGLYGESLSRCDMNAGLNVPIYQWMDVDISEGTG